MDGSGNFVVAWTSVGQDGSLTGVFAQKFSATDCVLPSTTSPTNQTACQGGTAFLTVTPSGFGPFTYQWKKNGVNLTDTGNIAGSDTQTLRVTQLTAADVAGYSCVASDYCLPPANATSGSATITVNAGPTPGAVTNLRLQRVNSGASLLMTWNNATNSSDYIVYEDTTPGGNLATQTGTSTSGATGLTIATPSASKFYLVAGRNATCGVGPVN
jgi:hypothetical protein